jgi:hypothetical protein
MPNRGSTFYALNRNKRSLAVDLKSEAGREIFTRLVRGADILLDNYSPGVLERLGFGYEWGSSINPGIIYCAIKGFLPGPYGDRPLLDELAQMMGSMAYMTGPAGRPLRAGSSVIDIGAATYGVLATLAALKDQGMGLGEVLELLRQLRIEPVLVAHPTESARRTGLRRQQRIADRLLDCSNPLLAPQEKQTLLERIRADVTIDWQTAEHPRELVTVADEIPRHTTETK